MNESLDKLIMTDSEIADLSSRQQEYFGILVERYEQKITRYIKRVTRVSLQDQQDILQNIFIKAYVNINSFKKNLSFNSWIYRIAHNEIIDWSRRAQTKLRHGQHDYDDEIFEWTADPRHFLKQLDIQENQLQIQQVLDSLEVKYREVLYLKFIEGYSYTEISDILKKPEGTIGTLINRAKKKFKEIYEQRI